MLQSNLITVLLAAVSAVDAAVVSRQSKALPLRITSFNIRYDADSSQRENDLEKRWAERGPILRQTMADIAAKPATAGAAVIFGLQEVLDNQLYDIKQSFGSDWDHIGVARDDGKTEGEYNPIIYKKTELKVVASETKWLTSTPDTPSIADGAGSKRIITQAVFEHIATGRRFIHANTHLDNKSPDARVAGAKIVQERIDLMRKAQGATLPVSLTGDFNAVAGTDAAKALTDAGFFQDLHDMATASQRSGEELTYTAFETGAGRGRIDFVWLGPSADKPYTVNAYSVVNNIVNGTFISDHRPVVGDITLK